MNLQYELQALKQRIAELEELAKDEQGFPQDGHWYWYITSDAGIGMSSWEEFEYQKEQLSIGNIFRTREQAEFALEKLKVEAELRKFSDSWDLEETQYTFSFDWEGGEFDVEYPDYNQYPNSYYFYSVDDLQQAIETVGRERIKKYIFGVEG